MEIRFPALVFLLVGMHLSAAEPKWIRAKSEHFEMYSSAGERSTRETLKSFEQVRIFFQQAIPIKELRSIPVRLVAFNSEKEYAPYKPNEVAVAYYLPGADHDMIVMSHAGPDTHPVAVHEYTHLVLEHGGLKVPIWLNEGLAEIFSTLRQAGNKVMIGEAIPGRVIELRNSDWVPLSTILAVDQKSPFYNERNKAGSLYDEGWALTHMLMLDDRYAAKFDDAFRAVLKGSPSDQALSATYGKPLSQIEKDLREYIYSQRFYVRVYPNKLEKVTDEPIVEPAPDFDVQLVLTELSSRPGQEAEVRKKLEALMMEDPKRPEPYSQLGYLAWRQGNQAEAEELFGEAYALGDRSRRMVFDYGRMAVNDRPKDAEVALRGLLTQEPGRVDVRIALAQALLHDHRAAEVVTMMGETKGLTLPDAPRFFLTAAYAYVDMRDVEHAKANLEQAAKYAKEERDKQDVQRLQNYLEQLNRPQTVAARVELPQAADDSLQPPSRPGREPKVQVFQDKPSVDGTFAELRCGDAAKIVLKTAGGDKVFVIEDPLKIVVVGKDGGKTDLNCGPQKPVPLRVQYEPAQPGTGVDGAVRILYFQ